jgi:transcriptional regulator with XRE-family HTH domain
MNLKKRREFGEWIKDKRKERGITLLDLAEKMGYNSRGTIGGVEAGQMPLPVEKIFRLAEILRIPLNDILEKIRECEPELYEKYITLEQGFEKALFQKIRSYGKAKGAEAAYHHSLAKNEEKVSKRKQYYILSDTIQWLLKTRKKCETIVKTTQRMLVLGLEGSS